MAKSSAKKRISSSCHWRGRHQDQDALDGFAEFEFLQEQSGHDRLAGAGVIGQQEAETRLRQHPPVYGLDLVGKGANAREADREVPVIGVGEPDAGGLDEET
jgi:hypothetical protein